jgi:hypothetical protein
VTEEIPEYLMARFRCGNEKRENRYCPEREEGRMCYEEIETIEHI